MLQIHFISLLSSISTLAKVVIIFGIITLIVAGVNILVTEFDDEILVNTKKFIKKYLLIPFITSIIALIFIPSKGELYMIYGVGSVIDYVKTNPTVKKLPDKVINILDAMADNTINKQEEESSHK